MSSRLRPLLLTLLALALVVGTLGYVPRTARADSALRTVTKVADPDTSTRADEVFGAETGTGATTASTELAGRIWVDKSVYRTNQEALDAGLPAALDDEERGFLVGLSALASSASIRQESSTPRDTVLVVNLGALLTQVSYNGATQAEHLVDALNIAIGRLMDEAPAGSRVALVGYTYDATVLMPLAAYEPDGQGRYVSYSPGSGGTGASARVVVTASPASGGAQTSSADFGAGSYLQRALVLAEQQLDQTPAGAREATLIVMGTDTPLTAHTDFSTAPALTGDTSMILGPVPGENRQGFGTDAAFATLLTLADVRQELAGSYEAAGGSAGIYTIGFQTSGMGSYVLGTKRDRAELGVSAEGFDLSSNMDEAATAYAQAAQAGSSTVEIPLVAGSPAGLTPATVEFKVTDGLVTEGEGAFAFDTADDYHLARSGAALRGAFGACVDAALQIEYISPAPAFSGTEQSTTGRFTARDAIGQGMNVDRVEGILYRGNLLAGDGAARSITTALDDYGDFEAWRELSHVATAFDDHFGLDSNETLSLFETARSDGLLFYEDASAFSNRVAFYVDADHAVIRSAPDGTLLTATQGALDALADTTWREQADHAVLSEVQGALDRGAAASCEVYFYVGDYENQYTGADVDLYDFVVMVETDIDTGAQSLLLSIPTQSVPARLTNVVVHDDGTSTMEIDPDSLDREPLRLVYEVSPNAPADELISRFEAGEDITDAEAVAAFGEQALSGETGTYRVFSGAFTGSGNAIEAGAVASGYASEENAYYTFAQDTPAYRLAEGVSLEPGQLPDIGQLAPLEEEPQPGETLYYLKTSYEAAFPSGAVSATAQQETAVMPYVVTGSAGAIAPRFIPNETGQMEVAAGTPKYVVPFLLDSRAKSDNATESAAYAEYLKIEGYTDEGFTHISALLGNNGAIILATEQPGSLRIEKTVRGKTAQQEVDAGRIFAFTIELADEDGRPVSGTFPISIEGAGTPQDDEGIVFEDGSARIGLSAPASILVEGLPARTRYTVIEDDLSSEGYQTLPSREQSGLIESGSVQTISFVNAYEGAEDPDGGETPKPDGGTPTDSPKPASPGGGKTDSSGSGPLVQAGDASWLPTALSILGAATLIAGRMHGRRRHAEFCPDEMRQ